MVNIYVDRILSGEITIDDVPKRWKAKVEKALAEYSEE